MLSIFKVSRANLRVVKVGLSAIALIVALWAPAPASAAGAAASLDQCTNGAVGPPVVAEPCLNGTLSGTSFANWVNGDSNGNKSHWREGDFISYRVTLTGLSAGSHTLVFHYDTVHGSKHAIDYLGSWDATEQTITAPTLLNGVVINKNNNNPCFDLLPIGQCWSPGSAPPGLPTAPTSKFSVPAATLVNCNGSAGSIPTQSPGSFTSFGPLGTTITSAAYLTQNAISGSGQCSTAMSIGVTEPTTGAPIVLTWGGHIASQQDWGAGNSATSINGSPYHMALDSLDGATIGSQDRALAASAIVFIPTVTTSLSGGGQSGSSISVSAGSSVTDQATLSGAAPTAGGTMTYQYTTDATCATGLTSAGTATVTNAVAGPSNPVTLAVGTYYWVATYSGDSGTNTVSAKSTCGAEVLTVLGAHLVITKTADAGTVNAGDNIGYVVTVSNTGAGTASGVTVTDTVPTNAGLSWSIDVSGTTGTWTQSGGKLTFGPQDVASGASFHVHITSPTTSATCGTVNNSASATSTNDGNPSVGPVPIVVNCANLVITKTADTGTVNAGDPIGYVVTISNSGAGVARSVHVTDTVPT
ncbi:MAG TPA: DUF11 domain-containing protein, partial [Candidatus Dormibacteraeota bacterium]|nr:DUF11 domain-containing protein [Candidatus Dormibacteraeota bacterium]